MSILAARHLVDVLPDSDLGRRWEALAREDRGSGFMQSLHWAEFKRKQGFTTVHIGLFEDETLAGGAIFLGPSRPLGAGILVAPEGPILPWEDEGRAGSGLKLIVEEAERLATSFGVMAVRIEPRMSGPLPRFMKNFGRAPVDLIPADTLYVSLSPEPAEILAAMHSKGRYNIGLAGRRGVEVVEDTSLDAVGRFYGLLNEAAERDDFYVEPLSFFSCLVETLAPAGLIRMLFAEHEGETLGALMLIVYGGRATYLYGGVSNHKREHMAGYALQWRAMLTARDAGCGLYDFYGIDPWGERDHLYSRFSRFKRQFGGEVARFIGAHDYYFLDRLADAVIKAAAEVEFEEAVQR